MLRKARMEHDADFLEEGVRVLSRALMEMQVERALVPRTPARAALVAPVAGADRRTLSSSAREQWRRVSEGFRFRFPRPLF